MSDKRTGKKPKKLAALQTRPVDAPPVVVSDLTQRAPMRKHSRK